MPHPNDTDKEINQLSRNDQFLKKIKETVESNLANENFSVKDLTEAMALSRIQLYRKLHKLTGKNISQYIREFRLERAMELLKKDVASISEIAYQVGFNSPAYFNKCFHDFFGYTPGELVKSNHAKKEIFHADGITGIRKADRGRFFHWLKYKSPGNQTGKLLFEISLFLFIIIVSGYFLQTFRSQPPVSQDVEQSIAVLPFWNDSSDPDNDIFCSGVMEEIQVHLTRIKGLKVASRTSAESFRGENLDARIVGKNLGVNYLLEGRVMKIKDNIRIKVQLIEVKKNAPVWTKSYDGKYSEEIFAFQTEVAKKVASSLNAVITPMVKDRIEKMPTRNILAYEYFIQGKYEQTLYWASRDNYHLARAYDFIDQALEIDPEFLDALTWKGENYIAELKIDSALICANKILEIDPEYAGANFIKAECYLFNSQNERAIAHYLKVDQNFPEYDVIPAFIGRAYCQIKNGELEAIRYFEQAISTPQVMRNQKYQKFTYINIGLLFQSLGEYEKAQDYMLKSFKVQKGCNNFILPYSFTYFLQSKIDTNLHFLDSLLQENLCNDFCYRARFHIYLMRKEFKNAEQQVYLLNALGKTLQSERPNKWPAQYLDDIMIAFLYKNTGKEQEASKILNSTYQILQNKLEYDQTWWIYLYLSMIHGIQKEKNMALVYLEKTVNSGLHLGWHDLIEIHPVFECLWDDPEFKNLIKLAQDEKAAIRAQVQEMVKSGEIDL